MERRISFILIFAVMAIVFQSCHTTPLTPVKSNIENTWTLMPLDPNNTVKWTFSGGQLSVSVNDVPVKFDAGDGATMNSVGYSVSNTGTNHYIYIDAAKSSGSPAYAIPNVPKFLVIKSKDDELFIESVGENGHKGEHQLHFVN